ILARALNRGDHFVIRKDQLLCSFIYFFIIFVFFVRWRAGHNQHNEQYDYFIFDTLYIGNR
ncbi:hypothetical protein ABET14_12780, partial [Heyndrickxia coagulans]|uniref:hypothetical protein n=1 Tax=Heyndrickxia coagulans TaxID=1398 RepID=UPI003D1A77FA